MAGQSTQQSFDSGKAASLAKQIKDKGNNARTLINGLGDKIHSVQGFWVGESSNKFIQEFDSIKPQLDRLTKCVDDIGELLLNVSKVKEQSEKDLANAISNK